MVLVLSLPLVTHSTQLADTLNELISTHSYHIWLKGAKKENKKTPAISRMKQFSSIKSELWLQRELIL